MMSMQDAQQRSVRRTRHAPDRVTRRRSPQRTAAALAACTLALTVSACSAETPEDSASESPESSSDATEQSTGQQTSTSAGEGGTAGSSNPASAKSSDQSEADASTQASGATSSDSTPTCSPDDLKLAVDQGDSATGHLSYTITFTNTGDQACTLAGHPGVSAVGDGDGTQIGASATGKGKARKAAVLIPNAHATADLQAVNVGDDGGPLGESCRATEADGWRIYPPDSTDSVYVEQDGLRACADKNVDWLSVSTVKPVS